MQKKIIALAVAAMASGVAFAQSNVTIYGVADVGYAYSTGGGNGSQSDVISGGLSGSRIGFRGVEDLGNGLKALFTMEYSVDLDRNVGLGNGAAGARQQFLGLSGGFGTVLAGRLQTAGYDFACATGPVAGSALDPLGKIGVGALLTCGGGGRANNAVAYVSPSFGGLTLALNHARVTEQAASTANDDVTANLVAATYAAGPLSVGAVYARTSDSDRLALTADSRTEWGLRGSYDFGMAKLFASYQRTKLQNADADKKYTLAVAVPVSAAGTVVVQYAGNSIDTPANADSSAYTLAYTHGLSKRTTVYAGYTHVNNDRNANSAAGFETVTAGKDPSVFAAGIRHTF